MQAAGSLFAHTITNEGDTTTPISMEREGRAPGRQVYRALAPALCQEAAARLLAALEAALQPPLRAPYLLLALDTVLTLRVRPWCPLDPAGAPRPTWTSAHWSQLCCRVSTTAAPPCCVCLQGDWHHPGRWSSRLFSCKTEPGWPSLREEPRRSPHDVARAQTLVDATPRRQLVLYPQVVLAALALLELPHVHLHAAALSLTSKVLGD